MKALLLVCVLVATSLAAPRFKRTTKLDRTLAPQIQTAEQAWSAAEAERDPAKQAELWAQAARAFDAVDGAPVDAKVKHAAAYTAVLAWRNAQGDAAPAPQLVAAIGRYVKDAGAADPDLPGVLFIEADLYRRADQLDVAVPKLLALVERYPRHEVGELAATLLLDAYNRLQRYDELLALADRLAKDAAFLQGRPELARTVAMIVRQGKRKHAEELERAAHATKDWDQYVAAATAFLEIYNAEPGAPDNDEALYNAGVTYEEGRAIASAVMAYKLLQQRYPNSRLVARATARLARLYGDIAYYDQAAAQLEEYAKRYAGEKDAYAALSDAIYYRKALGDRAKAIELTNMFIKTYGAKQVVDAANASWSSTALYEPDADKTIKHLREYLRMFGDRGGRERIVIAHAKIGATLWKQSCPHALVDGLCVKVKERVPRTCGAGTTRTMTATRRDAKQQREALAEFALAVKEYERQGGRFDDPAARYYYAQAKLAQADAALEAYTAGAPAPRLGPWLDGKRAAAAAALDKYDAVVAAKDPATAITATARRGIVALVLARQLVTGARPRDATCDGITGIAAPLEATAAEAFAVCLVNSTELGWFEASSAYCEQQLAELRPNEFPPARERRARPQLAAPVLALEPPLR